MRVVTHEDIRSLQIPPEKCFEWVDDTLRHKNEVTLPPKISLHPSPDSFYNVMPSLMPGINSAGTKIVSRHANREPSLDSQLLLYSYDNLELLALMDANWITAMRTGAVAAHTIKTFAVEDFKQIGLIGAGNTARATLKVLLALYPDRELIIKIPRYKNQSDQLARDFKGETEDLNPTITFQIVDSVEEAINDSDIIISAVTYQDLDFAPASAYKPGCLVVPIHTRGFMECDLTFDRIYCDDIGHVQGFKHFPNWPNHTEVADVLSGNAEGRTNKEQRIIVYNIGLSIHDIRFAHEILKRSNNTGQEISLEPPTQKTWI